MMKHYLRFKRWVYETIQPDASDSKMTLAFDFFVMLLIIASVFIVFAVTFDLPQEVMIVLTKTEEAIVVAFTAEYLLRIWTADLRYGKGWFSSRIKYVLSPMAIVDLLAILPFYMPYFLPPGMLGIRSLRLIRLLRIFKLNRHFDALAAIGAVIKDKAKDLLAVLFFMSLMVLFLSLLMYAAEHDAQPDKFENAISALWWAIETFTKSGTRGFYPVTTLGRIIGAVVSVLGICLIAIPTGIISSGLIEHLRVRGEVNGSAKSSVGDAGPRTGEPDGD